MVSIFNQINAGNFRRVLKDFPYPRLSISELKESLEETEKLDKISRGRHSQVKERFLCSARTITILLPDLKLTIFPKAHA